MTEQSGYASQHCSESVNTHIKRQTFSHTNTYPVCVSGSLWSMHMESSSCLYGCALCSLYLRGGGTALPLPWWETQLQWGPSSLTEQAGSEKALTQCHNHHYHHVLQILSSHQPHLLQRKVAVQLPPERKGDMTDVTDVPHLNSTKEDLPWSLS